MLKKFCRFFPVPPWAWFSACLPKCNWKIVSCTINSFCVGLRNIWAWLNYEVRKPRLRGRARKAEGGASKICHSDTQTQARIEAREEQRWRRRRRTAVSESLPLEWQRLRLRLRLEGLPLAYANQAAEDMHYAFVNNRSGNCDCVWAKLIIPA